MLKKGQIKFSKKAAEIAKSLFKKKKVNEFLIAIKKRGEQKPAEHKGFYQILLGEKQDPSSVYKVYTADTAKSKKLFEVSLLKETRLSMIFYPSCGCLLYIAKAEESKFKKIKLSEHEWPTAVLNENDNACISEFERKMNKKSATDLSNLILEINE
ncbi:MAG: hypothetical protein LBP36_00165 [Oscillospiraceae bacterium]|nr:hypothetical protein [Oscillospiraceae bacterium]